MIRGSWVSVLAMSVIVGTLGKSDICHPTASEVNNGTVRAVRALSIDQFCAPLGKVRLYAVQGVEMV